MKCPEENTAGCTSGRDGAAQGGPLWQRASELRRGKPAVPLGVSLQALGMFGGPLILFVGPVLCIIRCLAASPAASAQEMPVAGPSPV